MPIMRFTDESPRRRAVEQGQTGENVRHNVVNLRRRRGLTTRDLAALVTAAGRSVFPSTINKIEHGTRRIDVDDLVALAQALNVDPANLLKPNLGETCQTCLGEPHAGFTCNACGKADL